VTVFTAKGYRRTLMTDVGRELGLSHALLYKHVESKEALFQLALTYAIAPESLADLPSPLPTPAPGEALRPLADWTAGNSTFPQVRAALATEACDDIRAEFHGILDELYFGKSRRGSVDLLGEYVERRSRSGHLRPFPDPVLATQLIVETVAWFAWHRRDHPAPLPVDDHAARLSVHYLLEAALVPDDCGDPGT
jgi:AcrR family transcriptional regulator